MRRVATRSPYAAFQIEPPSAERVRLFEQVAQPLPLLIARGHVEAVRTKLEAGAAPDGLHRAAYCDRAEVVRLLLEHGADLEARDPGSSSTAVHWAVLGRGRDALAVLLDAGADPAPSNRWGETPLVLAVRLGRRDAAALLVAAGAPVRREWQGRSLLELALARGQTELAALLSRVRTRTIRPASAP